MQENSKQDGIIGMRIGMLTVLSEAEPRKSKSGSTLRYFNCLCGCGKIVDLAFHVLLNGKVQSCGCTKIHSYTPTDLSGCKFGMLTVLSEADKHIQKNGYLIRQWNCACECGARIVVKQYHLTQSKGMISCGCTSQRHISGGRTAPRNLVGNRYGMLTVLAPAKPIILKGGEKRNTWLCKCDCGNESIKQEGNILSGHSRSCGKTHAKEMIGKKYGFLTIQSRVSSHTSMRYYNCKCDCGNKVTASYDDLFWGTVTHCGCKTNKKRKFDLTGQTFGRLRVIRETWPIMTPYGWAKRAWLCRCTCGREVVVRQSNLQNKITRSCGCLKGENRR